MRSVWRCALCIALAALHADLRAHQHSEPLDHVVHRLPDLPGAADTAPGYFDLDADGAELGYASRFEKWSARFDRYLDLDPNVAVDYGLLLTNRLSAGGRFTRTDTFSEVVVNGIFAPQKNVRLRLTGAQLRNAGGFSIANGNDGTAVLQNSILLNARKYWNKYLFLSDLGLTAYRSQTALPPGISNEVMEFESDAAMYGRMDGYMVNLGLRPTARSRIEMRREFSHLSTYLGDDARHAAQRTASRVKYSHYLDNCIRVQGGVSSSTDSGRLDLNIARNNWSVNLSREQWGDADNTAIRIGYALPLGTRPTRSPTCGGATEGAPSFEPIVETSVTRPALLPHEPLFMESP